MARRWLDVPIRNRLFQNVQEAVLTNSQAALENATHNETGGITRFPGLEVFSTLSGNAPVYLHEWRFDLIAACGSRLYRIQEDGTVEDVTGVPISGGKRVIFDRTENELVLAAGGPIIRFAGDKTEILSEDAPSRCTHVGFIDSFVLGVEADSGRFFHSNAQATRTWDPLDVFAADAKPDNINSMVITPFREVIVCGIDSIEQYDRMPSNNVPFYRRWSVGEGISAPYTLLAADNGVWGVNKEYEFIRFSGQSNQPESDDIGNTLETVDDWSEAWTTRIHIRGQKYILLQIPRATNPYGTKGITALLDYRTRRWYNLFGWDDTRNVPARWPGWSYYPRWGRHFVGGEGKVYELKMDTYTNDSKQQRVLLRTAPIDAWGESRIDNLRVRVKRGIVGSNDEEPVIHIRSRRDNRNWSNFRTRGLGKAGKSDQVQEFGGFGCGHTHQFEVMIQANCELELVSMQVQITPLGE